MITFEYIYNVIVLFRADINWHDLWFVCINIICDHSLVCVNNICVLLSLCLLSRVSSEQMFSKHWTKIKALVGPATTIFVSHRPWKTKTLRRRPNYPQDVYGNGRRSPAFREFEKWQYKESFTIVPNHLWTDKKYSARRYWGIKIQFIFSSHFVSLLIYVFFFDLFVFVISARWTEDISRYSVIQIKKKNTDLRA